ncbi:MAG TPA: hypothetical protein VF007_06905 [Stellaceae bacterium]
MKAQIGNESHEMTRLYLRSSVAAGQPRAKGDGLEKRLLLDAEAGDARSQCNLGILYGNGLDDNEHAVAGNRPQAVKWLSAAAEQGLPRAQIELAEAYANAPDLAGSQTAACGWFLVAASRLRGIHLQRARSGYERIAARLTSMQIAEAHRFARDWRPKPATEAARLSPAKAETGDWPSAKLSGPQKQKN